MAQVDVAKLQRQLDLAWSQIANLKEENATLKRTIRAALAYWPKILPEDLDLKVEPAEKEPWPERSEHFDRIREDLLEVIVSLIRREGKAVHYDGIIRAFKVQHPAAYNNMKNPADTLSRRARELRDAGYLVSPEGEQGLFFIGKRLVVESQF